MDYTAYKERDVLARHPPHDDGVWLGGVDTPHRGLRAALERLG